MHFRFQCYRLLEAHVRAISRPVFERLKKDDRERREEAEFANLSVRQRLCSLFEEGVKVLSANKFIRDENIDEPNRENQKKTLIWSGNRRSPKRLQAVTLQTLEKFAPSRQGPEILKFLVLMGAGRFLTRDTISAHMVLVVLNSVAMAKVESYFPDFVPTGNGEGVILEHILPQRAESSEKRLFIHVISRPRSIADFRVRLTAMVNNNLGVS